MRRNPERPLWLLLAILLGACGGTVSAAEFDEIAFHRTPGKPLPRFDAEQPAEAVLARREPAGGFSLVVRINVRRPGIGSYTEGSVALPAEDWERLVALVRRNGLATYVAQPGDRAVDFGRAGYALRGEVDHEQAWSRPLAAPAPPHELRDLLASLARRHMADLPVFYLDP